MVAVEYLGVGGSSATADLARECGGVDRVPALVRRAKRHMYGPKRAFLGPLNYVYGPAPLYGRCRKRKTERGPYVAGVIQFWAYLR